MTKEDEVALLWSADVGTFDPRTEVDAHIAGALQIVIDADDGAGDAETETRRDYTSGELDTLFFALGCALVQLRKLPGGAEAHDRFYNRLRHEQVKHVKRAAPSKAELEDEAVKIVQRTFGASVDLSAGTMGAALVSMVVTDLENQGELRDKLIALAATIRQP